MNGRILKKVWTFVGLPLVGNLFTISSLPAIFTVFIKINMNINMKKILVSILIGGFLSNPFLAFGEYSNVGDRTKKIESLQKINNNLFVKDQANLGLAGKASASAIKTDSNADLQKQNYVPREVLVKFKNSKVNLQTIAGKAAALNFSRSKSLEKKEDLGKSNIQVLTIKDAKTVEQKIAELKSDPNVEYVEPNYKRYPAVINTNDTYKENLWGLDNVGQSVNTVAGSIDADIDAPEAWAISEATTTVPIIVAVIDSGVAYNHPDLIANMWDGTNCKDENGSVLGGCNHGYDYQDQDKTPLPTTSSHGTHIAGTIATVKNNSKGIIGIAPNAKIMAIKYGSDISSEVKAIDFAIQNGARIINASFAGASFSQSEYDAINRFKNAGGVFVAASGNGENYGDLSAGDNHDGQIHLYPSDYNLDNIISVAATNQNDQLADFSDFGATSVDVGAPGVNVYSTVPQETAVLFENFEGVTPPVVPNGWVKNDVGNNWGTYPLDDGTFWGKVLYGDLAYPYANNTNTTITSPAYNLSAGGATLDFWTKCDTEYITTGWADYMVLEFSSDGGSSFYQVLRWDEAGIDSNIDPSGSAVYHLTDFSIPNQYLTNNFVLRFRWVTNDSDNNYDGCLVDDVKITKFSDGSDEQYGYMKGTSMAAPYVAGLAALVWGYRPDLNLAKVKNTILTTGDSLASLAGKTVTGKRINAYEALKSLAPITLESIAIATPATKLSYTVGDLLDISGLVITGTYSDNSTTTETITAINVSGFDSSVPATGQVLTITINGKTATYAIDIVASLSSGKAIASFQFDGLNPVVIGTINETDHVIAVTVPHGTDITTLTPTIVISENATSSPASGAAQNFINPVTYTITAEDGSIQAYIVTVTIAASVIDFSGLNAAIASAQSLHDSAIEGAMPGQYAVGSKITLQTAITAAQAVADNPTATQVEVNSAIATLTAAVNVFESGKVAPDNVAPVIILNGENPVNLHTGDSYIDLGATASDNIDGNLTINIVTVGLPISTSVPGTFSITYNVSDNAGNLAAQVIRTVNVVDISTPVITLLGDNPIAVELGAVYTDAGATATDDADGNITDDIVVVNNVNTSVSGTYTVTYNVSDSSGNSAPQAVRTVNVADTTIPVITMLGTSPVNVYVGNSYVDVGATAADNIDGNITANITVVNPVNTNIIGAYVVTYNVSDAAGNHAIQTTRIVNVVVVPVTLTGIAIATPATKISYTVGDPLSIAGLVVVGTYSDNSTTTENITTANITGFNSATPATGQILTITVDGKTATYAVDIIAAAAAAPAASSGGGGGGGSGGSGSNAAITINKIKPQVKGASTEKLTIAEMVSLIADLQKQIKAIIEKMAQKGLKPLAIASISNAAGKISQNWALGQTSSEIRLIQAALAKIPGVYPQGLVTGYFGKLTQAAISRFQVRNNLPAAGIIDTATRQRLNQLLD